MIEITKDQRIANLLKHVDTELQQICGELVQFELYVDADKEVINNTHGSHDGESVTVHYNDSLLIIKDKSTLPF